MQETSLIWVLPRQPRPTELFELILYRNEARSGAIYYKGSNQIIAQFRFSREKQINQKLILLAQTLFCNLFDRYLQAPQDLVYL